MRHRSFAITSLAFIAVATVVTTFGTATDAAQGGQKAPIPLPQSLQVEHHAIHEALEAAVKAPGRTGAAAREVAACSVPTSNAKTIALPPLG
jgi:hypothetical protein